MDDTNRLKKILRKAIEHIINYEDDLALGILKGFGLDEDEIEEIRKEYL